MHIEAISRKRTTHEHLLGCTFNSRPVSKLITQRSTDSYVHLEQFSIFGQRACIGFRLCNGRQERWRQPSLLRDSVCRREGLPR